MVPGSVIGLRELDMSDPKARFERDGMPRVIAGGRNVTSLESHLRGQRATQPIDRVQLTRTAHGGSGLIVLAGL
jgi:hypothetical protein